MDLGVNSVNSQKILSEMSKKDDESNITKQDTPVDSDKTEEMMKSGMDALANMNRGAVLANSSNKSEEERDSAIEKAISDLENSYFGQYAFFDHKVTKLPNGMTKIEFENPFSGPGESQGAVIILDKDNNVSKVLHSEESWFSKQTGIYSKIGSLIPEKTIESVSYDDGNITTRITYGTDPTLDAGAKIYDSKKSDDSVVVTKKSKSPDDSDKIRVETKTANLDEDGKPIEINSKTIDRDPNLLEFLSDPFAD